MKGKIKTQKFLLRFGHILILSVIVGSGMWLRLAGVQKGFPPHSVPGIWHDEWQIVRQTVRMFGDNIFDPRYYIRPNIISDYLSAATYTFISHIFFGQSVKVLYIQNSSFFYLISRTITAVESTLMIFVAYFLGSRFQRSMGIFAAAIVAIYQPFIQNTFFASTDVTVSLYILCSIYFSVKYIEERKSLPLVLASIFVAIAMAEKYTGVFGLASLGLSIIAVRYNNRKLLVRDAMYAGATFTISLFLLFPWFFLESDRIIAAVTWNAHMYGYSVPWNKTIVFYLQTVVDSFGWFLTGIAIFGAIAISIKYKWKALPLFQGFAFLALMTFVPMRIPRYGFPFILTPLLFTAYGFTVLHNVVMKIRINVPKFRRAILLGYVTFLGMTFLSWGITTVFMTVRRSLPYVESAVPAYEKEHGMNVRNTVSGYEGLMTLSKLDSKHAQPFMHFVALSSNEIERAFENTEENRKKRALLTEAMKLPIVAQFPNGCDAQKMEDVPVILRSTSLGQIIQILSDPQSCYQHWDKRASTLTIYSLDTNAKKSIAELSKGIESHPS